MSMSPMEWKNELEPGDTGVLALIERKPYQAYTVIDLLPKSDNLLLSVAQVFVLHGQLDRLVKKGLIKSKNIRGTAYYISSKAI